jgi:hypothetical protein
MINPIKYLLNWFRLLAVQRTINKYRIYPYLDKQIILKYKPMLKRAIMKVIRVKVNGKTCGLLVTSQKKGQSTITYVDYIWVNEKLFTGITPETESAYYQTMYDVFMQWHQDLVIKHAYGLKAHPKFPKGLQQKVAISINISKERQIERFRRILTLYGFNVDNELTLKDVDFVKPWREKEQITNVVYSRIL